MVRCVDNPYFYFVGFALDMTQYGYHFAVLPASF
jgi:hypothetical protein